MARIHNAEANRRKLIREIKGSTLRLQKVLESGALSPDQVVQAEKQLHRSRLALGRAERAGKVGRPQTRLADDKQTVPRAAALVPRVPGPSGSPETQRQTLSALARRVLGYETSAEQLIAGRVLGIPDTHELPAHDAAEETVAPRELEAPPSDVGARTSAPVVASTHARCNPASPAVSETDVLDAAAPSPAPRNTRLARSVVDDLYQRHQPKPGERPQILPSHIRDLEYFGAFGKLPERAAPPPKRDPGDVFGFAG